MVEPWERMPGESHKAFLAFVAYLELGEERSLVKVGEKSGKHRTLIERWSSRYRWVERAQAYDTYEVKLRLKKKTKANLAYHDTQAKIVSAIQGDVLKQIKEQLDQKQHVPLNVMREWEINTRIARESVGTLKDNLEAEKELHEQALSPAKSEAKEIVRDLNKDEILNNHRRAIGKRILELRKRQSSSIR